ncbi:hypothetical protein [Ligilactobacillus acidipiscis]|uniref:Replication protein B n=2 Tax=Ligilactobacillus acidipiscis TaxID=89059 RepID=A0A2R8FGC1_9LACO|nr:hypothetical protein [Ligilactobacillus acidipiscis]SPO49408.1 hypothetical protein PLAC02_P02 [Ligilactobacillus acidipiscis]
MTKTVKNLADELKVSRQYIHKVINLLPEDCQPTKIDNKYIITDEVEKNIKGYMKKDHTSSSTRKLDDKVYSLQQERIADLKEQNSFYEEQIKALQKQLENSQRLVDQEQQLHLSDQKRIEKLEQPDKEQKTDTIQNNSVDNQQQNQSKKGFFKRFFGK